MVNTWDEVIALRRQFPTIGACARMRVLRAFSTASSKSAKAFLREARRSFPFPIRFIRSDNGSEFPGFFNRACIEEKHVFSHPRTPKDNAGRPRASLHDLTPAAYLATFSPGKP